MLAILYADGARGSALDPAGTGAEQIHRLFLVLAGGASLIWLAVMALTVFAVVSRPTPDSERTALRVIKAGGVAAPLVLVSALMVYGLSLMPGLLAPGQGLVVEVTGERWWWRVRYLDGDRAPVISANDIRLPRGERVTFRLESADVIHAFWVPALGGKIDMIPGRTTELVLEPTRTGVFRGVCAEYCGTSHTLMAFTVTVMEPAGFEQWLQRQRQPAALPDTSLARRGQQHFLQQGCGACHRIAGTPAEGRVGPDLTHLAARPTLGAGTLENNRDNLKRWMGHTDAVKPGVLMPSYAMLGEERLAAIATYLAGLR